MSEHPEHQSKQEITEEELLRTVSECSLRAGIGIGKAEKASQHSAPPGETAMQIAEEWFSGGIPRTFPTRQDAVEAMAGIISRHLAKQIGMWDESKPELGPQEPRAETWHKERENWADEVNRLRSSVSKQERMREALEKIAKDTVSLPCDDPQCGDSTWDHECTAGRQAPSHLAEIARAALSDVTEQER